MEIFYNQHFWFGMLAGAFLIMLGSITKNDKK